MKFNNRKYKFGLKESDLIGDIEGFPIEVVEKMLERQSYVNKIDVSVFQKSKTKNTYGGAFDWGKATEGYEFWNKVIYRKDFDLFFEKYPKK